MTRIVRLVVLLLTPCVLLVAGSTEALGDDAPVQLIARADAAYMARYLQESMTEALVLYEAVLPSLDTLPVQSQAYVLNRLSELCYEAAMFTEGNTPEDKTLFVKGKEYGLRSLRLNDAFAANECGRGSKPLWSMPPIPWRCIGRPTIGACCVG